MEHGNGSNFYGGEEFDGIRQSCSGTVHHGETFGTRAANVQNGLDSIPRGIQCRTSRLRRYRDRVALLGRYQVRKDFE